MQKKFKKYKKGQFGTFYQMSPNVEHNIAAFNASTGDATGQGTSASGGLGEDLDQINSIKLITQVADIPVENVQLFPDGTFFIHNIDSIDAEQIINNLTDMANIRNISKIKCEASNKFTIRGQIDTALNEGVFDGIKNYVSGKRQEKKEINAVYDKTFAALWKTKKSNQPLLFIFDYNQSVSMTDLEDYITKFGGRNIVIYKFNEAFYHNYNKFNTELNQYKPDNKFLNNLKILQANNQLAPAPKDAEPNYWYKVYYGANLLKYEPILKQVFKIAETHPEINWKVLRQIELAFREMSKANDNTYSAKDVTPKVIADIRHKKHLAFIFSKSECEHVTDDFKNQCMVVDLTYTDPNFDGTLNYKNINNAQESLQIDEGLDDFIEFNDEDTFDDNIDYEIEPLLSCDECDNMYLESELINTDFGCLCQACLDALKANGKKIIIIQH